jgi:two-component system cell cycle sensor histidine kinase/response regulator CckA
MKSISAFELGTVVDLLHDGVQVIGDDFRYRYVNVVAAAQGKTTPEALVGRLMVDAYPGIDETEMFGVIQRIMAEGGTHTMENCFAFPDGSSQWFELRFARMPLGVVVLSLDITDRKRSTMQTERAQRMEAIGQLASGLAHDFNNLLTVIDTYASFAADGLGEHDERRNDLAAIRYASLRAAELTKKLLTFSRQVPLVPRVIAIDEATASIVNLMRRTMGGQYELHMTVAGGVGGVLIDPTEFDQVLLNLIINARDAMPAGGVVAVDARNIDVDEGTGLQLETHLAPGSYVRISVRDTGVGIPLADQSRIFEPFFSTKTERGGTGLGLAVCWGIVAAAGGVMTVESEPGLGTCMNAWLPSALAPAMRAAVPTMEPPPQDRTVLVVDDQAEVRVAISRSLRRAGFKVLDCSSGAEALHLLEQPDGHVIDLVLSEVMMPGMSGIELAVRIQQLFGTLPVQLMTGCMPVDGSGIDNLPTVLVKPMAPERLVQAVAETLRHFPRRTP